MEKMKKIMRTFGRRLLEGWYRGWWYIIIIGAVATFDQITKKIAAGKLKFGSDIEVIKNLLSWKYHENSGSAYGMFSDARWVFMTVSTIGIIAFILFLFGKSKRNLPLDIGLSFVIGGGIGNMIDRIFLGYVIDFIGVSIGDFKLTNYSCNVADVFVCVGGALVFLALFIQVIREEAEKKKQKDAVSQTEEHGASSEEERGEDSSK